MTPREREAPPALYGDGVHDDTDALNWYFDRGRAVPPPPAGEYYRVRLADVRLPDGGFTFRRAG